MARFTYEESVFLNCPFDEEYEKLFWAIVFTIHDCGFVARCAREVDDSSDSRISKIYRLIEGARLGIHEISRTELDAVHHLPRQWVSTPAAVIPGGATIFKRYRRYTAELPTMCEVASIDPAELSYVDHHKMIVGPRPREGMRARNLIQCASKAKYFPGVALAALAVGCGGDGSPSTYVVTDSAGVEIVQNRAPMWDESDPWTVGSDPLLEIGAVDGPEAYRFTNAVAAWRRSDGQIVIADQPSSSIRVFDDDGTFQLSMGRPGEGPGEFQALRGATPYRGDSIAAWDSRLNRLTVFDREGRLGRTVPVAMSFEQAGEGDASFGRAAVFRGAFGDGSVVVAPPVIEFYDEPEDLSFERPSLRLSPEGDTLNAFGPFPGSGVSSTATPFPRHTVHAVASDRMAVGTGDSFAFRVFDSQGELLRLVRASHRERPVDEGSRNAFFEARRERARVIGRPEAEVERELADVAFPPSLPPYSALQIDASGHIWVRDYNLPSDRRSTEWSVFDPEGRLLGMVELPEGLEVHQIGPDFVLGVWTDELDVPYVRLYALRRD